MIKGLSQKLKLLRKQYGLSQRAVASHLGISTSVISAYENGERTPSTENLLVLSYLYKWQYRLPARQRVRTPKNYSQ